MKNYHARRLGTLLRALRVATSGSVQLWLAVLPLQPAYAEVPRLAVFNFELLDTSLEGEVSGENEAEQQRLVMISGRSAWRSSPALRGLRRSLYR